MIRLQCIDLKGFQRRARAVILRVFAQCTHYFYSVVRSARQSGAIVSSEGQFYFCQRLKKWHLLSKSHFRAWGKYGESGGF